MASNFDKRINESFSKYFDNLTKKVVFEELSVSRKAQLNKLVRTIIYSIYTDVPGKKNAYFNDPDMYCNKLKAQYISGYKQGNINQDYKNWIYSNRHKFFDSEFKKYLSSISISKKLSSEEMEYMKEYYNLLTISDYARNLYLSRDSNNIRI